MKHTHYIRQSYLFCLYRNYMYDFKKYLVGKTVLEVGPNKGALFEKYYPLTKKYTLLEPNRHFEKGYIKLQKRYPNLHYEINDFEAFSTNETFDTIIMMAVMGLAKDMQQNRFLLESGGLPDHRDQQYKEKSGGIGYLR
jgi:16S rRNA A1518/A1519 N6-dimethyltransferase RsmA/KsgA/DIM1 with predicted DNA glycosylase/AP lyase activity